MSQFNIEKAEWEEDQVFGADNRRFAIRDVDQPKRTPIRRKDKMRSEEKMKAKTKRSNKKLQQRIKYEILSA